MSLVACSDGVAVIFGVLYLSVGIGIFIGIIDKLKSENAVRKRGASRTIVSIARGKVININICFEILALRPTK